MRIGRKKTRHVSMRALFLKTERGGLYGELGSNGR